MAADGRDADRSLFECRSLAWASSAPELWAAWTGQ